MTSVTSQGLRSRLAPALVVVAILALAINLRPAAVSVGPVLDELRAGLEMSTAEAGVLTALPVIAFALFGALAPRLARLLGVHRLTLISLVAVAVGLWARTRVDSVLPFLALTLFSLAGMATANVVLPSLVKLHFPTRIGLMTSAYSTAMAIGLTCASVLTVPIAQAHGGWRFGLMVWSFTAAIAVLPWLGLVRHDRAPEELPRTIRMSQVARTRLGRRMAIFFGLQSLQAYAVFGWFAKIYRDAGFSSDTAGVLLGVITGMSIPLSLLIPTVAARVRNQSWMMWVLMGCYPIGYTGLILAPHAGAWAWAVLVGVGACTFPLILTLVGLRARTPEGTAALSGFTQGAGYLLAAIGPFGVGLLHDLSGGWTVPLLALTALTVPQLWFGLSVSRPVYLEDELASARATGD